MGDKGKKLTNAASEAVAELEAKLAPIDGITTKKMFGGYGVFHEGKMFGLVNSKGLIHLKASGTHKDQIIEQGGVQHSRMPYYTIPGTVWEDFDQFLAWANEAIAASKK